MLDRILLVSLTMQIRVIQIPACRRLRAFRIANRDIPETNDAHNPIQMKCSVVNMEPASICFSEIVSQGTTKYKLRFDKVWLRSSYR